MIRYEGGDVAGSSGFEPCVVERTKVPVLRRIQRLKFERGDQTGDNPRFLVLAAILFRHWTGPQACMKSFGDSI